MLDMDSLMKIKHSITVEITTRAVTITRTPEVAEVEVDTEEETLILTTTTKTNTRINTIPPRVTVHTEDNLITWVTMNNLTVEDTVNNQWILTCSSNSSSNRILEDTIKKMIMERVTRRATIATTSEITKICSKGISSREVTNSEDSKELVHLIPTTNLSKDGAMEDSKNLSHSIDSYASDLQSFYKLLEVYFVLWMKFVLSAKYSR